MVPVGLTSAGGALVACTAAVGTAVAAGFAGAEVAAGAAGALAAGALAAGSGTAVAEDPQANSRTTNSNTIAFGKFFIAKSLKTDCDTFLPLLILTTLCG